MKCLSEPPGQGCAGACSILTASHTAAALAAFTAHAGAKYPDCMLHKGGHADNRKAIVWLNGHGFRLLEESINHKLFFDEYAP